MGNWSVVTELVNTVSRWVSVLNNSRTEALEKAFGDSDKAEVFNTGVKLTKFS